MASDKESKENQIINVILPMEMYDRLRKCSFENKKPLTQICREGIEQILKKYEKNSK